MSRVLHSDPHVTVSYDEALGLVRYVRSPVPYASMTEVRAGHGAVVAQVRKLTRAGLSLLVDVRAAPARNDPEFEAEIVHLFQELATKFTAHAILLKSAVGRLQTQRLSRERGAPTSPMFSTEEEALAHLGIRARGIA
jgi:hypothetical protein